MDNVSIQEQLLQIGREHAHFPTVNMKGRRIDLQLNVKNGIVRKLVIIILPMVIVVIILTLLIRAISDYWTPKSYTLNKIPESFVATIEKEFLFRLPENAVIDRISVIQAREITSTCYIKGTITPEEFLDQYVDFMIGEKSTQLDDEITYSISGFSDHPDDKASVSFKTTENITRITIQRSGGISNELMQQAEVHKGKDNLIF